MSGSQRRSAQQRATLGLPEGFTPHSAFPFKGIDQSASRIGMEDTSFYWLENYILIGPGNMRTLWDAGADLYAAPSGKTIVSFFWFNIGSSIYCAVFLSDGTAVQVAYPSGSTTTISAVANTFYNSANGQLPACCQSGTQYLMIGNHNTQNDYWLWDGSILYAAGSIAPTVAGTITDGGEGYTSVPSYTVFGGTGSGVVLTPVIADGSVVSLTVDDPGSGYSPADIVQVAFSGGGSDTTPILTASLASGVIEFLTLVSGGSGYPPGTFALGFSGGGGTGATGTFTVDGTGVVQSVNLTAGGSGYTGTPTVTFPIPGSGASITATEAGYAVVTYTIPSAGTTYTTASGVATTTGGAQPGIGTGLTLNIVASSGPIASSTLASGGKNYQVNDTGTITGGSGDATYRVSTVGTSGEVTALTIVTGGSGYTPGTYPLAFSGASGSGAQATYTVNASGVVASYTLIAGGTGYLGTPTVSIPTGTGAAVVASLTSGAVASITVVNGGTNLTGTPTLTLVGGGGTGATAVATVSGGAITSVSVTAGGSGYTSDPAVEVQTGVNNAAYAILNLMPFGISGTSIETYQSRVFISYPNQTGQVNNGGTMFLSAPDSLTDFATSDGGDIFVNSDRFLRQQYTILRQTSNFLYAIGDSSVSVISNVQTSGTPTSTTFSYQNTDPQIGSSWRDTAQDFGNTIVFANPFGVFGVYGGSVRKNSKKVDNIFTNAVLPPTAGALTPSSATANIYSQKVYLLLLTITDPFTQQPRNVMLMWDGAEWFVASQAPALIYIGTKEVNSNISAWGTDGAKLYPLFNAPSSTLVKVASTKQWGGQTSFLIETAHSIYIDAVDNSAGQGGLTFAASIDGDGLAVPAVNSVTEATWSCPPGSYAFSDTITFQAAKPIGAMYGAGAGAGMPQVPAVGLGITLATSSPDLTLRNITLGTIQTTAIA